MERLTACGEFPPELAAVLACLVRGRYSILISGATNSGKSSLLNALAGYLLPDERIITIEDSAELQFYHVDNLVRLETRNANAEGANAITMNDLIKASLRMRPTRIIVGEVRGEEAGALLTLPPLVTAAPCLRFTVTRAGMLSGVWRQWFSWNGYSSAGSAGADRIGDGYSDSSGTALHRTEKDT